MTKFILNGRLIQSSEKVGALALQKVCVGLALVCVYVRGKAAVIRLNTVVFQIQINLRFGFELNDDFTRAVRIRIERLQLHIFQNVLIEELRIVECRRIFVRHFHYILGGFANRFIRIPQTSVLRILYGNLDRRRRADKRRHRKR